jgi:hypothetical protein
LRRSRFCDAPFHAASRPGQGRSFRFDCQTARLPCPGRACAVILLLSRHRARGLPRSRLINRAGDQARVITPVVEPARGRPSSLCRFALLERARGTPDARAHPQPRVRVSGKHTSVVTTVAPEASGVPHAVVFTACFVLIPGVRCWVHHRYVDLCERRPPGTCAPRDAAAAPMARADAPGSHDLGRPRAAWSSSLSPHDPSGDGSSVRVRRSNTVRGHRIPPRAS